MGKKLSQSPWTIQQSEYDERIARTMELIGTCPHKRDIKQALRDEFDPNMSFRTIDRYIQRARAIIIAAMTGERQALIADQVMAYRAIAFDKKGSNAIARVRALERIDRLLGLEAPRRAVVGHAHFWNPAEPEEIADRLATRLADFADKARVGHKQPETIIDEIVEPETVPVESRQPADDDHDEELEGLFDKLRDKRNGDQ